MILSTCGARAVVFHTTSFVCRAACARRTNHHGAVVASSTAGPACRRILRRVHMGGSLPVNVVCAARGQPLSSHLRSPTLTCGSPGRQMRRVQPLPAQQRPHRPGGLVLIVALRGWPELVAPPSRVSSQYVISISRYIVRNRHVQESR